MRATSGNKIRPQSGKVSVGRVRISDPVAHHHYPDALAVLELRVLIHLLVLCGCSVPERDCVPAIDGLNKRIGVDDEER